MKRITMSAARILAALVLAACTVTVEVPGPPEDAISLTATSHAAVAIDPGRTYAAGEEKVFHITVPSNVGAEDLLYIELNRDLRLEVRPAGTSYPNVSYSSTSHRSFGSGLTGLSSAAAGIDGQAITAPVTCRGSCVILEAPASEFYVRVVNTSGVAANGVNLYVYGDVYNDEYEPGNDSVGGAVLVNFNDSGAIETVNDVDWWRVDFTGQLAFDSVTDGIDVEAYITDASGNPIPAVGGPYHSGDVLNVVSGDRIRVWASSSTEAAASSFSTYYLENLTPLGAGQ